MCGIFGFTQLNRQTRNMAWFLAYSMEARGADSWGATDGNEVIKFAGPISASFAIPKHWKQAIFHTRSASIAFQDTKACKENAHPFTFNGVKKVIGCHNGYVGNWRDLDKKYCSFPVDSMHVYHHMAEGLPIEELEGKGTLAWTEAVNGQPKIHLARWNYGDLEIARLGEDNGIVFCSEELPILKAARLCRIPVEHNYQRLPDGFTHIVEGRELLNLGETGFKKNKPVERLVRHGMGLYTYPEGVHGIGTPSLPSDLSPCRKCGTCHTKHVICLTCFKALRLKFEEKWPQMKKEDKGVLNWGGFLKI